MAETKTLRTQILLRNDSAAKWKKANPVLGKAMGLKPGTI